MECERVREEYVERLTGTLDPSRIRAIEEHLAGCVACRAETERLRALWEELGSLAPAPSAPGARRRVEGLVDARARSSRSRNVLAAPPGARWPAVRRTAFVASAIAASLLLGVLVGRRSTTQPTESADRSVAGSESTDTTTRQQYLLLLEGPARTRPSGVAPSAADSAAERAIVQEYGAWAGQLARSGALVRAEKLTDDELTIHARDGVITPVRNAADEVGGFFLIQVADSAEAHRIARESPHLKYGGTIQVRRIEPT